jgi:hypothetical protein
MRSSDRCRGKEAEVPQVGGTINTSLTSQAKRQCYEHLLLPLLGGNLR